MKWKTYRIEDPKKWAVVDYSGGPSAKVSGPGKRMVEPIVKDLFEKGVVVKIDAPRGVVALDRAELSSDPLLMLDGLSQHNWIAVKQH